MFVKSKLYVQLAKFRAGPLAVQVARAKSSYHGADDSQSANTTVMSRDGNTC
jgi:hypothetical protein